MLRKPAKNRRNRRSGDPSLKTSGTDATAVFSVDTKETTLTFDLPIVTNGIPASLKVDNKSPVSAARTGPNSVVYTFADSGAAKAYVLAAKDPAIRTRNGGYAAPAAGTFS